MRNFWQNHAVRKFSESELVSEPDTSLDEVDVIYSDKTYRTREGVKVKAGSFHTVKNTVGETRFKTHAEHEREGGLLIWGKPKVKTILRKKRVEAVKVEAKEEQLNKTYIDARLNW